MAYTPTRQLTLSSNPASIAATMPDGGQSGFVVPLHIKYGGDNWEGGAADIFASAQSGGQDITFWSSDGLTQYAHSQPEIYTAAAGSQELLTRILVPSLSSSVATEILVQYGDAVCAAQWSAGSDIYKPSDGWLMFSPMNASDGLIEDWTGISPMTPLSDDRTVQVDGMLSNAQRFDAGKILGFAAGSGLSAGYWSDITISCWMKPQGGDHEFRITDGGNYSKLIENNRVSDCDVWLWYGGILIGLQAYTVGEWQMMAFTFHNDDEPRTYVQNIKYEGSSRNIVAQNTTDRTNKYEKILNFFTTTTATGAIFDDIQVSNNILSLDWLDTQNAATRTNGIFWTVGDAEALGGAYRRPPLTYRMGPKIFTGVM